MVCWDTKEATASWTITVNVLERIGQNNSTSGTYSGRLTKRPKRSHVSRGNLIKPSHSRYIPALIKLFLVDVDTRFYLYWLSLLICNALRLFHRCSLKCHKVCSILYGLAFCARCFSHSGKNSILINFENRAYFIGFLKFLFYINFIILILFIYLSYFILYLIFINYIAIFKSAIKIK